MSAHGKVVVFSFTIYGDQPKYCQGLLENLALIREHYPSFKTHITIYNNVPATYVRQYMSFDHVCVSYPKNADAPNMVERFMIMDDDPTIDVMLVRDADSRIHARDRYCIDHFLGSTFECHTIRDHHLHHSPVMGGLWGIKRSSPVAGTFRQMYQEFQKRLVQNVSHDTYGYDMHFLRYVVYPKIVSSMIVYTFAETLRLHASETIHIIPFPVENLDFCGQVMVYDPLTHEPICEHDHPGKP